MKIAIIGAGNMGGATAVGFCRAHMQNRIPQVSSITATALHQKTLDALCARVEGVGSFLNTSLDNAAAVADADMVIVAVKPWQFQQISEEVLSKKMKQNAMLVCLAAGISAENLSAWYGTRPIFKLIPNLAIEVGESMSFISRVSGSDEDQATLCSLFDAVGKSEVVEDRLLGPATILASCGTAYALRYIRASVEGGIELGLRASLAQSAVAQTMKGAAMLLEARGTHPEQEIDRVTTPGGITIRGLNAMEEAGFT
ncbi:MAG: NAD(P)-binding domain-containing protein, partial [Bacteroidales bacterium]|nr:NAD(P)-binding domain-containing protein [Bacteroidales bacterium]